MLFQMKLGTKISLLVVVALLGMLAQGFYSVMQSREDLLESRRHMLKSVLEGVHATLADFHAQELARKITREEAQQLASEAIRRVRYGGKDGRSEYVYAFTTEGVGIYHVIEERIGQNMLEKIRDSQGNYTWKDILKTARGAPAGGYIITLTARPGDSVLVEKLGYARVFEPWSWVIGTGSYVDDIDTAFRERLLADTAISLAIAAVIAAMGFAIGRVIMRQVGGEPSLAIVAMQRVAAGDLTGTIAAAPKGSMMDSLSQMTLSLKGLVAEIGKGAASLSGGVAHISGATKKGLCAN